MSELSGADLRGALGFLGDRLTEQRSLGDLCTYRVGGPARWFAEVVGPDELVRLATVLAGLDPGDRPEVLVVGKGSNLLVADQGFDGLAVQLGPGFDEVLLLDAQRRDRSVPAGSDLHVVRAGAAASLPVVARRTVAMGLTGFEWAVGVPGSIGGAVRMNAGGHGADLSESLLGVRVVDLSTGEDVSMDTAALELGYRRSGLRADQVVVHADLGLHPDDLAHGATELGEIVSWRRANQPGGQNAGSVFTNPPGDSAGRLIDVAGCKGLRVRSASVSDKHANFIQVDPGGSADDVAELMATVIERVERHSGVRLHPETVLVGFDAAPRGGGPP